MAYFLQFGSGDSSARLVNFRLAANGDTEPPSSGFVWAAFHGNNRCGNRIFPHGQISLGLNCAGLHHFSARHHKDVVARGVWLVPDALHRDLLTLLDQPECHHEREFAALLDNQVHPCRMDRTPSAWLTQVDEALTDVLRSQYATPALERAGMTVLLQAYRPILEEHTRRRAYHHHSVGSDEDVVQQGQLHVVRSFPSFLASYDYSQFGAWVYTITRNSQIDFVRRQARIDRALEKHRGECTHSRCDENAFVSQVAYRDEVASLLEQLDARTRTILKMRFVDNMTGLAIADALGCSGATVSRQIKDGLEKLRQLSEDNESNGGAS